eukprot:3664436-Pleurochrysis_carterae.AAC.1
MKAKRGVRGKQTCEGSQDNGAANREGEGGKHKGEAQSSTRAQSPRARKVGLERKGQESGIDATKRRRHLQVLARQISNIRCMSVYVYL